MKRLSFLVLFLLSVFATNVFAESEVSVWGGYTGLDVDKKFDQYVDSLNAGFEAINAGFERFEEKFFETYREALPPHPRARVSSHGNLDNAFTVGLDCFFGDYENVKPGFRVGYLRSGKRKICMSVNGDMRVGGEPTDSTSFVPSFSLISVMPGVKLNFDISEKFSLDGKLFAGIAKINGFPGYLIFPPILNTSKYGFAADISVGAQYLLTKKFGLGLDLGYRPFPADFSGFTATLGLNFKI